MKTGLEPKDRPWMETPVKVGPEPFLYPVSLKLEGRRCLVVGGGTIALHKARELLRCGARVEMVAPDWPTDFGELDGHPDFRRMSRAFQTGDLEQVFLVVAATDDREVQNQVAAAAEERSILCNVVDVNDLCSFHVPAILRRGSLTVAVGTAGKSPLLAVHLRNRFGEWLGPHLGEVLDRLGEARRRVRARYPESPGERKQALKRLLTPQALDQLMNARLQDFEEHWQSWISSLSE
ncbi:MAG: bifunctional precorrin-2 dehydrogenase/sirohydrochlorin ferrochelatase [Acidobacteriota bacterium]